jgi:nucleoside-diphosphate-sugar epimerase
LKTKVVLLSGASGFLGSHLAKDLALNDFRVIAMTRSGSDLSRFNNFESDNLTFVNTDSTNFELALAKHQPEFLIHSAWQGVSAKGRVDWQTQVENISITTRLLLLANELKINKVISFGSQAEYGNFDGRIAENAICKPSSAYGAAKLAALNIFKSYCDCHNINWFWLRLFSTYGTHEGKDWLIPSVISNLRSNIPMDLTECEQCYDYLFTKDLSRAIINVLNAKSESGIFNLSSNSSIKLKELIEKLREKVNPEATLNFGSLPYRPNQVMHMEGDSSKFNRQFDFKAESDYDSAINEIVSFYKNNN